MKILPFKQDWNKRYYKIKVTPASSKNEVFCILDDDTIKIRIKAPADKWKANKELISFLSKEFEIKKNNIEIISWFTDQIKIIRVDLLK